MPFAGCVWRDSVKMRTSHTSANVCCIHDEDDKREVQLEVWRWLESKAWSEG
jgi:hypothetical protein